MDDHMHISLKRGLAPFEVAVPRSRWDSSVSSGRARFQAGFTLIEVLISTAIVAIVAVGFVLFGRDLFAVNDAVSEALRTEQQAGPVLKEMIAFIRTASPSSAGSYPLAAVSSSTLSFYTNINADGAKERVRYFTDGTVLKMGVLSPTGAPPVYNEAEERIKPIVRNLSATSTPLFRYYDAFYTGTSSPLAEPIDINKVRSIRVSITVDKDPAKLPEPLTFTGVALIRNLKDTQ